MARAPILSLALVLAACSGSSSSGTSGSTGTTSSSGSSGGSTGTGHPCGPSGVFGTYAISGGVQGFESICGLQLGAFDGGTLTIAQASTTGATITITGSTAGNIDVSNCAGTVSGCEVSAPTCPGAINAGESISFTLQTYPNSMSGSEEIGFNSCQAPGGAFTGSR